MKELTNYRRAVQYLTKIVNLCNEHFFNGELPEVTVTIQENLGTYAHISVSNTWFTTDKSGNVTGTRELNIAAQHLTRPIENVVSSCLHELSHLYNMEHGIKDTSGYYHNKKFKKTAEEIAGLIIEQDSNYGWTITSPGERVIEFCLLYELSDICIGKAENWSSFFGTFGTGTTDTGTTDKPVTIKPKTRNNSRKWVCPSCGLILRSTRDDVNVECLDCHETLVRA